MSEDGRADKGDASTSIISRHGEFYLTDEMTVFHVCHNHLICMLVENRLFRVHQHYLAKNSPIFRSMFSLPRIPREAVATVVEGASDENPINLSGVTVLEFETLLRYFYGMHDHLFLPRSSWIALLSIAHRYEFLIVRARAIREIYRPLKEWSRMKSEKYDVPLRKVVPSFIELVIREEPLTEVEIANLSTLTVHRLAGAHEDYLRKTAREAHSDPHSVAKIIVRDIWPEAKKKNGQ